MEQGQKPRDYYTDDKGIVHPIFDHDIIRDDDGDTKIQVEEGADEDKIRFDTGGAERLIIDSAGKVGIGTSSPATALHIKANTPGTIGSHPAGQLIIQDPDDTVFGNAVITGYESDGDGNPDQQLWYLGSSSSSNSDIIFLNRRNAKLHLGTGSTTRMTIVGDGKVGIGTTTPGYNLEIEDLVGTPNFAVTGAVSPFFVIKDTTNQCRIKVQATDNYGVLGTETNHNVHYIANNTTAITIKASNNTVGIGGAATNPGATLDVLGNGVTPSIRIYGSANPYLEVRDSTQSCRLFIQVLDTYGRMGTFSAHNLEIMTGNTARIYLTHSTGRVGIGIAPKTKLTIEGTLTLKEQANAEADTAAYGQLWVKTATPNELWFTSDDGVDHQVAYV